MRFEKHISPAGPLADHSLVVVAVVVVVVVVVAAAVVVVAVVVVLLLLLRLLSLLVLLLLVVFSIITSMAYSCGSLKLGRTTLWEASGGHSGSQEITEQHKLY